MLHLWAFDPGETTGWCHMSVFNNEVGCFNSGESDHSQIGNMLYDNPALRAAVAKQEIETVFVVEKFIMNAKITQSPWSLETTGLIRYFASYYHIPLVIQTPSQAKNLIKNDVIKRAGLWVPGKGHSMDAVRHALCFLTTKKGLLTECLRTT